MNDNDDICKTPGESVEIPKGEVEGESFVDLYDFLGIPPASPPNLIFLAIHKIEHTLANNPSQATKDGEQLAEMEKLLKLSREKLFANTNSRVAYEHEWENYYFPRNDLKETNIECSKSRSMDSKLLKIGLKYKTATSDSSFPPDKFNYRDDFSYLMMRDRPKERDVFFLDTEELVQLPPLSDSIFFDQKQFCLRTHGHIQISITNDALGKSLLLRKKPASIPLHIGDRMEFESGIRLILRGFYTRKTPPKTPQGEPWGMYFEQERVKIPLDPQKIYIIGRNTSDIRNLSFDEETFCFINIGRRERSISRQNFQMFFRDGQWFLQDLGSRYGTTLDFNDHLKFETLAGGSIMALERGKIRLGYDKSYLISIDKQENLVEKPPLKAKEQIGQYSSIYDLTLL